MDLEETLHHGIISCNIASEIRPSDALRMSLGIAAAVALQVTLILNVDFPIYATIRSATMTAFYPDLAGELIYTFQHPMDRVLCRFCEQQFADAFLQG